MDRPATRYDVLAYALYPKVYMEYAEAVEEYGDLSVLDTPTFFYGMRFGEEIEVEIETRKNIDCEIGGHRTAASQTAQGWFILN